MGHYGTPDDAPATEYFSGLASDYDRFRPSYPTAAIAAMMDGLSRPLVAADVGCGTGIATRMLGRVADRVIGIEPNEDMRATARQSTSQTHVTYQEGTAEASGLPDGHVDLVLCAQAFHWFEAEAALREFHRILKPDGRLALMWNVRQNADPFSTAYNELMDEARRNAREAGRTLRRNRDADPSRTGLFHNVRKLVLENPAHYTRDELFGRARSASYFPTDGALYETFQQRLTDMFRDYQRDDVVTLHQQTQLTLADRVDE